MLLKMHWLLLAIASNWSVIDRQHRMAFHRINAKSTEES